MLQDLDIDFKLVLNSATYDRLMEQIQKDCALLEALRVMDYSMLLGVHYLSWGPEEWHPPRIKVRVKDVCFTIILPVVATSLCRLSSPERHNGIHDLFWGPGK